MVTLLFSTKKLKRFFFLAFFLLTTQLIASTLNLSISSNPSRINPILSNDSASSQITGWIFNGLFKYDKDANIVCDLASSYRFENNTTLIVDLKQNVKWHDGVEFNAYDVVYTYDKINDPKIYTAVTTNFLKVKSVQAIDKFRLKIVYKEPYFKALEIWMVGILPKHIFENEKDIMTSIYNKQPIGTGPYKLDELKISQDIELFVNKNYFDDVPKIEKIKYKFVPDSTTSYYMLQQKQLDLGGLTPIQIDRQIDDEFKSNFNIFEKQSFTYTYLGFNLKSEKFKNKKVREAINLAIDREELIDILFFGHAKVCHGPFLPGTNAFNKLVIAPKRDIEKSKKILKSLGYDKTNKFTFTVVTNANNTIRVNAAEILQYQLAQANIDMKIKIMEWQAFLNTVVYPRNFDAVILGWGLSIMPDARSIWHSSSDKKGGFNFIGYKNTVVDSLIQKGERTIEQNILGDIYKDIFKHIVEDIPYLFLYIPNDITTLNKDIKNVKSSIIGVMHNQQEWIKIKD